jgi:hypothetical protein
VRTPTRRRGDLRGWRPDGSFALLVAICVAAGLFEWALVDVFDPTARPALAPQAAAVGPFAVFHDLRWIAVGHDSWPTFALEMAAMLLGRGALGALSVRLAWPAGRPRPSGRRLLWRGVGSTALAAVLLVPSASLLFGLAVVPVSWLFIAAVPLAVLVALVVHPVAVSARWWRQAVPVRALGWMLASFLALTAAGAAVAAWPTWAGALVSALTGVVNALAWVGVVHAVVDREPWRFPVPMVPVALVALVAVVIVGATLGFVHARPPRPAAGQGPSSGPGQPVLIVSGYGSTFGGGPASTLPGDFLQRRFSYRGLGSDGAPLPYGSTDTVKSLGTLDRMMAEQITALSARTGRRVDVVAESEGSLVAKTAILAHPQLPVQALVMASPLLAPGRTTYPQAGAPGWGLATGAVMNLIGRAFKSVSPVDLSPDSTFVASVDEEAPVLRDAMSCPLSGVRQLALLPLADATVTPPDAGQGLPEVVVASFHGGQLSDPADDRLVARFLHGRSVPGDRLLSDAFRAVTLASAAWQVPGGPGTPTPASCQSASEHLASLSGA